MIHPKLIFTPWLVFWLSCWGVDPQSVIEDFERSL